MVACRYPDSLRKYIEPSGFTPWMNVLLNATTCGPKNPARFKLVVSNVDWYNVAKSFGKYKADRHSIRTQTKTEVAEEADNFVFRGVDGAVAWQKASGGLRRRQLG